MIAALNRFISRSADRCRPFYLLINKWKGFNWSEECIVAFQQLKEYLSRPPIMSNPAADEVLYVYIAVSLVLIREDNDLQRPVYYVSKSQYEVEIRYSPPGEGNTSRGPCFEEPSPLLPSPHSSGSNLTTFEIRAPNRRLHRKDRPVEHNSGSFQHQVYAVNLHKGPNPGRPSGRIRRTTSRNTSRTTQHGGKTYRHGLRTKTPVLESVC